MGMAIMGIAQTFIALLLDGIAGGATYSNGDPCSANSSARRAS